MIVNMTDLRAHLKAYLDRMENGEEITIIRHSQVIGYLMPTDEAKTAVEAKRLIADSSVELGDRGIVKFRRYGLYEAPEPIQQLHRQALAAAGVCIEDNPALDSDLLSPASHYEGMAGEFWVGELDGTVVAMGAFRLHVGGEKGQAELKRMRIRPDLQGRGIGSAMLALLEDRAKHQGYVSLVLDTVVGTPAPAFYERNGYLETHREAGDKFKRIYYRKGL